MKKLTNKQLTEAIRRSARKHGYYASTVRTCSRLLYRAIAEYREKMTTATATIETTATAKRGVS